MSMPRPVYPGATYLITRRVSQRMYLLRPSRTVDNIVHYKLPDGRTRTAFTVDFVKESKEPAYAVAETLVGDGWIKTKQEIGSRLFAFEFLTTNTTLKATGLISSGRTSVRFIRDEN